MAKPSPMDMIDRIPLIPPDGHDRVRNQVAGWNARAADLQQKLNDTTSILRKYQDEPELHLGYGDSGNAIFAKCNGGVQAYCMNLGFLHKLLKEGVQLATDAGHDPAPWQELLDRSKMHLRAAAARWMAPFTIGGEPEARQ